MAIRETGPISGDKPLAYTDRSRSAGSVKDFNEAVGRSTSPASSPQAQRRPGSNDDRNEVGAEAPVADGGEELVNPGASEEDFAPIEVRVQLEGEAPAAPDVDLVAMARDGRHLQFPSFDGFTTNLARQVDTAEAEAWTNGLYRCAPFAEASEPAWLRQADDVASIAHNPVFAGMGSSAAPGTGASLLATCAEALVLPKLFEGSSDISGRTRPGQCANPGAGTSFGANLIDIDARSHLSIVAAAVTGSSGGRVVEEITHTSKPTSKDLGLGTGEQATGGLCELVQGGMNTGIEREGAKTTGVGEAPGRTRANLTVNDPPASAQTASTGEGAHGGIAACAAGEPLEAAGAEDAGDTLRMRKPQRIEGSRPPDPASVPDSKLGEIARGVASRGGIVEMHDALTANAANAEPGAPSVARAKTGSAAAAQTLFVDRTIDGYLQRRSPAEIRNGLAEGRIARIAERERPKGEFRRNERAAEVADATSDDHSPVMAIADGLHGRSLEPAAGTSRPTLTEAQLNAQLKLYEGVTELPDGWHGPANRSSPITPAEHSWLNPDRNDRVDGASGGGGGDSSGSGGERREQRRYRKPDSRERPDQVLDSIDLGQFAWLRA